MTVLRLENVAKLYPRARGELLGLHRIDLEVARGELVCLVGPSGCGKTTTLRCIAGLEKPDRGRIELNGATVFSAADRTGGYRGSTVPPEQRGIGMVFQDYALWPHMDVFKNVSFGLRGRRRSRAEITAAVERALRAVELWDHRDRRISQLSGGQQQRVALARALAPEPRLILFDEPLSNLDSQLRSDLRSEILDLHRRMGLTSVWVTHDHEEALGMSSHVVLMNEGWVEQAGTPAQLWGMPETSFAAGFFGSTNRIPGIVAQSEGEGLVLEVEGAPPLPLPSERVLTVGDRASAYVRPGAISILGDGSGDATPTWRVRFDRQTFHGDYVLVATRLGDMRLQIRHPRLLKAPPDWVDVHIDPRDVVTFRDGGSE